MREGGCLHSCILALRSVLHNLHPVGCAEQGTAAAIAGETDSHWQMHVIHTVRLLPEGLSSARHSTSKDTEGQTDLRPKVPVLHMHVLAVGLGCGAAIGVHLHGHAANHLCHDAQHYHAVFHGCKPHQHASMAAMRLQLRCQPAGSQ